MLDCESVDETLSRLRGSVDSLDGTKTKWHFNNLGKNNCVIPLIATI